MATTFEDGLGRSGLVRLRIGDRGFRSHRNKAELQTCLHADRWLWLFLSGQNSDTRVPARRELSNTCSPIYPCATRAGSSVGGLQCKHNIEQRLARWLLHCVDRVHSYTYALSHDSLARSRNSFLNGRYGLQPDFLEPYFGITSRLMAAKRSQRSVRQSEPESAAGPNCTFDAYMSSVCFNCKLTEYPRRRI
jgi:hypothetical protein